MHEAAATLRRVGLSILIILFWFTNVLASEIILKNGDRITGVVTHSDDRSLTIRSPLIGNVQIPRDAVERASIQESTKVAPAAWSEMQTPRVPDFLRHWSGFFDPGFSLAQGNANTRTLNLAVSAVRTTSTEKITLSSNWLNTNSVAGGKSFITAKAFRSGVRYDVNLNEGLFVFGSGDWEYDRNQHLDLRNVLGSGLGWHASKRDNLRLNFLGGGNFNREYFSTGRRSNFAEAILGHEANYRPNEHLTINGRLTLVPNLTETGHYRAIFETSSVISLNKYVGWQITLSDRYTSLHLAGVRPNDLHVTTGLHFAFTK